MGVPIRGRAWVWGGTALLVLGLGAWQACRENEPAQTGPLPSPAPAPSVAIAPSTKPLGSPKPPLPQPPRGLPGLPAPELDATCREVLARLRALPRSRQRSGRGEPAYEQAVEACLHDLQSRLPGAFDGLLALYRELPRPGDEGEQRVRTAILYVLPDACRPEFDAEVSLRFLAALRDPASPERPDLPFLLYAARLASDASAHLALAEAMPGLADPKDRRKALLALACNPCPADLPHLEALWEKDGAAVTGPLAYALGKLRGDEGLALLRSVLEASEGESALKALAYRDSAASLDLLLDACAQEGMPRAAALQVVAYLCHEGGASGRRCWSGVDSQLGFRIGCRLRDVWTDVETVTLNRRKAWDDTQARGIALRLEPLADPSAPEAVLIQLCNTLGSLRCGSSLNALAVLENDGRPGVRDAALKAREAVLREPR